MKKVLIFPAVIAAFFIASCGSNATKTEAAGETAQAGAAAVNYAINPAASTVEWKATKVTGKHNGSVAVKAGELKAEAGIVTAGAFTLDMKTIKVLDVTDAEMNGKLTGHLNSDDFFATAKNPEAKFEISAVEAIPGAAAGSPNYTVKGNLTIKGITKAITFPATISVDEKQVTANASVDIDRTEWDIKYGSGKFFQDIGDKAISDNFTVIFNIVANPKV